jgi:hypothetical protein
MVYVVVVEGFAVTLVPVLDDNPVVGAQAYVVPPEAVNVAPEPPLQIVALVAEIVGNAFGVAVTLAVVEQEPKVEVAVYVPAEVNFAYTVELAVPV